MQIKEDSPFMQRYKEHMVWLRQYLKDHGLNDEFIYAPFISIVISEPMIDDNKEEK